MIVHGFDFPAVGGHDGFAEGEAQAQAPAAIAPIVIGGIEHIEELFLRLVGNTVDLAQMSEPSQLLTILLMLTGGSPGSTAGGFKTTTFAVLLLSAVAVFRRRRSAQCFGRRIQEPALQSACAIFLLYILFFLTGGILICCIDQVPLMDALFEAASAIGTVGLSLGGTARFPVLSRLVLIFLMYFGRVGGLTLIYAVTAGNSVSASQFPQEPVTVG